MPPGVGPAHWAVLGAILAGCGVLLGLLAAGETALPGDLHVLHAGQRATGPIIEALAWSASRVADVWPGFLLIATAVGLTCFVRGWPELALFVAAVAALRAVNVPMKQLFASPRPPVELARLGEHGDGFGFPSGHAFGAALLFGSIAVVAPRIVQNRRASLAIQATALIAAGLVAWSRVWLGVHWPTDTIGGLALGFGFVCLLNAGLMVRNARESRFLRT